MKHTLPIAIAVVAAAAAVTGVISFQTGVFQTASVGEVVKVLNKPLSFDTPVSRNTDNSVPESVAADSAIGSSGPECNSSTKPWIQVLSPNGNETYTPGHKVTVKWVSCNISSSDKVHVSLIWKDSNSGSGGSVADASLNDNNEVVTLPSSVGTDGSYKAGKLYKVQIVQDANGAPNYNGAVDTSDDYFSITSKK